MDKQNKLPLLPASVCSFFFVLIERKSYQEKGRKPKRDDLQFSKGTKYNRT